MGSKPWNFFNKSSLFCGLREEPDQKLVVEVSGIEPLTSCMPCKRSPS